MSSPGCLPLQKGNCRSNSSLCPPVLPARLVHSRNASRSAGCACQSNRPALVSTGDVNELHPALDHDLVESIPEEDDEDKDNIPEQDSPTRRGWLAACLTGLSSAGLHVSSAKAFPSPELEGLQESCATSSTRLGQKAGISALRDPAIYRYVSHNTADCRLLQRLCCQLQASSACSIGCRQEANVPNKSLNYVCCPSTWTCFGGHMLWFNGVYQRGPTGIVSPAMCAASLRTLMLPTHASTRGSAIWALGIPENRSVWLQS